MSVRALLLLTLLSGSARAAVDVPVAVMPFKNLNGDPTLDWLKAGIAETMVSDLKKGAGLAVVERAQLDHALTELALRGAGGTEESTAAQVGKLTGAHTVVLGSYQTSGTQIRIAARFVSVETGVVQDAAKVTGPLDDIFRLQDEIVTALTGSPKASAAPAPARKPRHHGPQVVKAYRLYAMSLETGNDAEKVGYLRDSLKEDSDFTYAADELAALEGRMKGYDEAAQRARDAKESQERHALQIAGDTPEQRSQHVLQLLTMEMTTFRYRQLLDDAQAIEQMDLGKTSGGMIDPHSFAAYAVFMARMMLKQRDQALGAGERFLKNFPESPYFGSVEMQMNQIIRERREVDEGATKADNELAKIANERAVAMATIPFGPNAARILSLDSQPCTVLHRYRQYERAIAECHAFAEGHRGSAPLGETNLASLATYFEAQSLAELGRFTEARSLTDSLMERDPAFAQKMALKTTTSMWPRD